VVSHIFIALWLLLLQRTNQLINFSVNSPSRIFRLRFCFFSKSLWN
jgi:hypothetical protein